MKNDFDRNPDGTITIHVHRRNGERHRILIDATDFDLVARHSWHVCPDCQRYYARAARADGAGGWKTLLLHRLIVGDIPAGHEVTFVNGNPLDCRRANLRTATHLDVSQGKAARPDTNSGHRHVYTHKPGRLYVSLMIRGKRHMRYCRTIADAIEWRDATLAANGLRIDGKRRVTL